MCTPWYMGSMSLVACSWIHLFYLLLWFCYKNSFLTSSGDCDEISCSMANKTAPFACTGWAWDGIVANKFLPLPVFGIGNPTCPVRHPHSCLVDALPVWCVSTIIWLLLTIVHGCLRAGNGCHNQLYFYLSFLYRTIALLMSVTWY